MAYYPIPTFSVLTRQCKDRQGHEDRRSNEARHGRRLLSQLRSFQNVGYEDVRSAMSRRSFFRIPRTRTGRRRFEIIRGVY